MGLILTICRRDDAADIPVSDDDDDFNYEAEINRLLKIHKKIDRIESRVKANSMRVRD